MVQGHQVRDVRHEHGHEQILVVAHAELAVRVSKQTCWDEPGLREAHLEVLDAALAHELNV